jgi:AcrR family transcriptional regulator
VSTRETGAGNKSARSAGRARQKARTRRLLLDTAVRLIAAGQRPTVAEVADAADVSRRTAYRYFPTQEKLHAEAALDGLRPVMQQALESARTERGDDDVGARVTALVGEMQRLAIANESLLRTMIHQTVLQTPDPATPRRGTRRLEWIASALEPVRASLDRARYARLSAALALCTGIEALLVLRDICGLSEAESIQVSQWMSATLLQDSLRDARTPVRKVRRVKS